VAYVEAQAASNHSAIYIAPRTRVSAGDLETPPTRGTQPRVPSGNSNLGRASGKPGNSQASGSPGRRPTPLGLPRWP
jgi:hypothetical protein